MDIVGIKLLSSVSLTWSDDVILSVFTIELAFGSSKIERILTELDASSVAGFGCLKNTDFRLISSLNQPDKAD